MYNLLFLVYALLRSPVGGNDMYGSTAIIYSINNLEAIF